jgi:tetratricopeptide (TPR) repeat protein
MNNELYIQVKRYFTQEMSPEERSNWEAKLASDASFAEEVTPLAMMYESIQMAGDQRLNTQLNSLGQQLLNASPKAAIRPLSQRKNYLFAIAASILLILSLVFVFDSKPDVQEVFAENFSPISGSRGNDSSLTPFMEAYTQAAYAQVIDIYEQEMLDTEAARQPHVNLYLGVSYLAQGQAEEAKQALEQVGNEIPSTYDDAQWYLALAYLKLEQLDEAKKRFENIVNDSRHEWHEDALKILKTL